MTSFGVSSSTFSTDFRYRGSEPLPVTVTPTASGLDSSNDVQRADQAFHKISGNAVVVNVDLATRRSRSSVSAQNSLLTGRQCYVFCRQPLHVNGLKELSVEVVDIDSTSGEGIAFGMTSCNPAELLTNQQLPDDPFELMDRPEYWVVVKDVLSGSGSTSNCDIGDRLTFLLMDSGEVRLNRNGCYVKTLMVVDHTIPMWPFLDIFGRIRQIRLLHNRPYELAAVNIQPRNYDHLITGAQTGYEGDYSIDRIRTAVDDDNLRPQVALLTENQSKTSTKPSQTSSAERWLEDLVNQFGNPTYGRNLSQLASGSRSDPSHHAKSSAENERTTRRQLVTTSVSWSESSGSRPHLNESAGNTPVATAAYRAISARTASDYQPIMTGSDRTGQRASLPTLSHAATSPILMMATENPAVSKLTPSNHLQVRQPAARTISPRSASVDETVYDALPSPISRPVNQAQIGCPSNAASVSGSFVRRAATTSPKTPGRLIQRRATVDGDVTGEFRGNVAEHSTFGKPEVPKPKRSELPSHGTDNVTAAVSQVHLSNASSETTERPFWADRGDCCRCAKMPADCIIYRCGHVCLCSECADELRRAPTLLHCPMCNNIVEDVVKIFVA